MSIPNPHTTTHCDAFGASFASHFSGTCLPLLLSPPVSAVDAYEFSSLQPSLDGQHFFGDSSKTQDPIEFRPMFHEWATVQPGMICLARKKKTAVFRQYIAAETAVPVISCAACLPKSDEKNYFFAGIARSKSVRSPDDGIGPNVDEFFTVSIGGMATLLNTSGGPVYPGDLVEWCFTSSGTDKGQRARAGPRRIGMQVASVSSPKLLGRALSVSFKHDPPNTNSDKTNSNVLSGVCAVLQEWRDVRLVDQTVISLPSMWRN